MSPSHNRMSRVLGFCLHLPSFGSWQKFAALALVHLSRLERVMLAHAALRALAPSDREEVARTVLKAAGGPLPAFLGGMDDARFWASMATNTELKAYALAAYDALPVADQNTFRWHIGSVEVAV